MPADADLLFGTLAVAQGFCTQAQVDECVQMQTLGESEAAMGDLLLFKGFITAEQHARILDLQKANLKAPDPLTRKQKETSLFGKIVAHEGLLSEDQVNECLRDQAREGETRTLGEIMVAKGYLSADQVKELLGKQLKRLMSCPACKLSFTVLSLSQNKRIDCPRCKGPLGEGKPTDSTRTDAEFATQAIRMFKSGVPRDARPESGASPPPAKRVNTICPVCDSVFEGAADSTGRVRCPTCKSTFVPR